MLVANDLRHSNCPLCASTDIEKVGDIDYFKPLIFSTKEIALKYSPELWACKHCKSSFTQNAIPEHLAANLYTCGVGGERWVAKTIVETKHPKIVGTLDKLFRENSQVLDIGCNTGELLDYAKMKGCFTSGVEFCQSSREIIQHKGHKSFPSLDKSSNNYDVITGFDLVEHLYDVPAFLNTCRNKLTKDGRVVLLTGDISAIGARMTKSNWWYVKYPEHIVFPSRKYFIKYSGFQLEHCISTYASREFDHPFLPSLTNFINNVWRKDFFALPSLGPDHILMVLKK